MPDDNDTTPEFPDASRIVLRDLQQRSALNGHLGVVVAYMPDQDRYRIRPLGRIAKQLARGDTLAVRAQNLRLVDASAFVARVDAVRVALRCRVEMDDNWQPAVRILYDDFLGQSDDGAEQTEGSILNYLEDGSIITTPIDEEYLIPQRHSDHVLSVHAPENGAADDEFEFVSMAGEVDNDDHKHDNYNNDDAWNGEAPSDEVLILPQKPIIRDLFDAMIDYELLEELDKTVAVGLHGNVQLCRLVFPHEIHEESYRDRD